MSENAMLRAQLQKLSDDLEREWGIIQTIRERSIGTMETLLFMSADSNNRNINQAATHSTMIDPKLAEAAGVIMNANLAIREYLDVV